MSSGHRKKWLVKPCHSVASVVVAEVYGLRATFCSMVRKSVRGMAYFAKRNAELELNFGLDEALISTAKCLPLHFLEEKFKSIPSVRIYSRRRSGSRILT